MQHSRRDHSDCLVVRPYPFVLFGPYRYPPTPRYELRSFLKLGTTKPITTLQSAASFACDILITTYLCLFLKSQKGDMIRTNLMMDLLIHDAINRGVLTALSSGINMVLFLAVPDTFWYFLGLAPSLRSVHEQHDGDVCFLNSGRRPY
ncbi:hypothetical protein R3P38DRAFT_3231475 [Favolaschia claudopus]|uniref:DUF6534 domain-containing protein n=1 Tax=Favolaschia claudopus TaxID=2862362 RepID=A0AAV9ZK00_9AGAR